jgi:two-component system, chemotaxis family, chemotaxis protein CheY
MFRSDARFLVIDDSKTSRDLVRVALKQLKYMNVDEAEDGLIGLAKIQDASSAKKPYSLVFCDINMPEIDGLKLLETIRLDPENAAIPVIIITTEGDKPTVIRAVMSGVSGYMVKPFGVDDVKKKLEEVYKRVSIEHGTTA